MCTTSRASTLSEHPTTDASTFASTAPSPRGGRPLNLFLGVQNVTNRRNFASYSWNRRTNTQQFGKQQGIFPIAGLDWRF